VRKIVLDTETTGLSPSQGHRIIEIGCVELIGRRLTGEIFHVYINPEREVDAGAENVHGISTEFLQDKPLFAEISSDFQDFIKGAELIIHNAAFDVGFMEHEFKLLKQKDWYKVKDQCEVTDTLKIARKKHPGQRNNLDALCKRYKIDNAHREKHGALLDAEILAEVYLAMTGGQSELTFLQEPKKVEAQTSIHQEIPKPDKIIDLPVVWATEEEVKAHDEFFKS
jgi:DNA polymerase-3 subunit epsilon